jgi:hypothetical protein
VREIAYYPGELTVSKLLQIADVEIKQMDNRLVAANDAKPNNGQLILELGRDYLVALHCPQCEQGEKIGELLTEVLEDRQLCPYCGIKRQAAVIHTIAEDSPYIDHRLSQLYVPVSEVLLVYRGEQLFFYQLKREGEI